MDAAVDAGDAADDADVCPESLSCRGGFACCDEGEECVDDLFCAPVCSGDRCGNDNLTCCGDEQVCLDGVVCAKDCAADQALCGETLDVCCDLGDVCTNDTCVTPGADCGDDFDCLDEGTYCEHVIGKCLPLPAPPLCEVRPEFDKIALEVEWHWEGVTVDTFFYDQVSATPSVGDVSGDGVPDVVFPAYRINPGQNNLDYSILVALSGDTGALLWTVSEADAPQGFSTVALGDLDPSDDALEVAYKVNGLGNGTGGLRVLDGDGTTELARLNSGSVYSNTSPSAVSLADMDHDGDVELVVGCHIVAFELDGADWELRTVFDGGNCGGSQGFQATSIANLDADADLEITSGGLAYNLNGSLLWPADAAGAPHGYVAVADLDVDGDPEVITIRNGSIFVRDGTTGTMLVGSGGTWYASDVSIPGGGVGGAPTVADFDGDGFPEVSAAGQGAYAVYDPDCLVTPPRVGGDCMPGTTAFLRWSAVTQDVSSSITGSSVFDFQGDGVSEVIYNDECWLHIYDGRTGEDALMAPRPNSSRTATEYPLVVDVDRDGNSEIVVPANNDQAVSRDNCDDAYSAEFEVPINELPDEFRTGTHGIYVFGDPNDRWVRTRPVWNQYAYHVTNVEELGGIPMTEADNWSVDGLNNYRTNVQGEGVFNVPNLQVELSAVASCAKGGVILSAVVTNAGSRGVESGVAVTFVRTDPGDDVEIESVATTVPLLPGGSERITVMAADQPLFEELAFRVLVDGTEDTSVVLECLEDDNTANDDGLVLCAGVQ
jgi:hypothetical protein